MCFTARSIALKSFHLKCQTYGSVARMANTCLRVHCHSDKYDVSSSSLSVGKQRIYKNRDNK